jgi:hypothetical protein
MNGDDFIAHALEVKRNTDTKGSRAAPVAIELGFHIRTFFELILNSILMKQMWEKGFSIALD